MSKIEIGIDSFASVANPEDPTKQLNSVHSMNQLLDRIEYADQMGLDVFGIGEHHRVDFLDSAPTVILAAAAARTKKIKLTSAVTVLSAADPVTVFQNFATLDIISNGRAEMVLGRGSFIESFPLFGFDLNDYDALFEEKLGLLLELNKNEVVNWKGKFRPPLINQAVYPRPVQNPLPVWIGVGGTPESFIRAGKLGLPLMIAIIGGETHRFRPLVDLYRQAGLNAGFPAEQLTVGLHSFGYVASSEQRAFEDYYPGYQKLMTKMGKERGWAPVTESQFLSQTAPKGAYIIGSPENVAQKIIRHSEALGGITRLSFQMDVAGLSHEKLLESIKLIGTEVIPLVKSKLIS